jgi:2-phospho-L-lactate guanylyltransferase (CobY/MobA/RfbA family)
VPTDLATTSASVIICCYTHERWDDLQTAIASVLAQSPEPEEVVVVVDHNPGLSSDSVRRSPR